jgi:integrase/recombinase XerD
MARISNRKAPVSLKDSELLCLLGLAKQARERDWIMILLTYWHGLRASETLQLKEDDFSHGQVLIRRGKGSDGGWQTLQTHENVLLNEAKGLEAWLANRRSYGRKGAAKMQRSTENVAFPPSDRLFPLHRSQFWRIVHGYALAAGIPLRKCKTHMLKHTIAKHLIREGLPVNEVQAWLGWRSLETALHYLKPDEEELSDRVGQTIRRKSGFHWALQGNLF